MIFPEIRTIDAVLPALQGRKAFAIKDQGDYIAIDYNYAEPDTFADPIRRECRGIKFAKMGELLARPYHKFFNIGEKEETQPGTIDWSLPHMVLEKLDGSMVHPFYVLGVMVFGTRAGITDIAMAAYKWADQNWKGDQWARVGEWLQQGWTPIFEWCSPGNQIVIRYPEDRLVLTGLRNNLTGAYAPWVKGDVPHEVKVWRNSVGEIGQFLEHSRALEDQEGYVVRFADGFMCKVKADAYVLRHKARDSMLLEKNVLRMVLEGATDDVLPLLAPADAAKLTAYDWDIRYHLGSSAIVLADHVAIGRTITANDRKRFAVEYVPKLPRLMKAMAFRVLDGAAPYDVVKDCVLRNCGSAAGVDAVRDLIGGVKWS